MPEKKKQHYVPKFYMKLFSNSPKTFSVLNVSDREVFPIVPYDNQCYKDYYYGKDGVWENRLAEMERNWSTTIQRVLDKCTLTDEDIVLLKQFALYQRQRTIAEETHSKQVKKNVLIEASKIICANQGLKYNEDVLEEYCAQRVNETVTPAEILELAEQHIGYVRDLSVVAIEYQTEIPLVSSDTPVISINPFYPQNIGYASMGLIMLFPISPHHLVVIYDKKMYPNFKGKTYVQSSNEKEVLNLNVLQLISAEKILFGKDPSTFSFFKKSQWIARERNRNSKSICAMGTDTQKIIATSLRTVVLDCTFSFGRLPLAFLSVPFPCREAVPRIWEKEWEEKLKIKISLMDRLIEREPFMLERIGLTKKELRKGFKKMLEAAKWCWRGP